MVMSIHPVFKQEKVLCIRIIDPHMKRPRFPFEEEVGDSKELLLAVLSVILFCMSR